MKEIQASVNKAASKEEEKKEEEEEKKMEQEEEQKVDSNDIEQLIKNYKEVLKTIPKNKNKPLSEYFV